MPLRRLSWLVPYLIGYLVILLIWDVVLNVRENKSTLFNYMYAVMYSLPYFIISMVAFDRLRKVGLRSAASKAILFMSIGATIFAIAFWVYTYLILKTNVDVPYPSIADYLFLSFVPFVAIGFSYLIRIFTPVMSKQVVWQSVLMVLIGVAIMYVFVIGPKVNQQDISSLERVFNIIYPLDDAILLSLILIAVRTSGGRMRGYFLLFIITFCIMIAGDLTYSYRTSLGIQWNGDIADLIFTFAAFFFTLSMIKTIDTVVQSDTPESPVQMPAAAPQIEPQM